MDHLFQNGLGEPTFLYVALALVCFALVVTGWQLDRMAERAVRRVAGSLRPVAVPPHPDPFPDDDRDVASITMRSPT